MIALRARKGKNKRFTAKLSRNAIEKNYACLLSKLSENRIQVFRVHSVSHFDMEINIDSSIKITNSLITRVIINTSDYDLHRFMQV